MAWRRNLRAAIPCSYPRRGALRRHLSLYYSLQFSGNRKFPLNGIPARKRCRVIQAWSQGQTPAGLAAHKPSSVSKTWKCFTGDKVKILSLLTRKRCRVIQRETIGQTLIGFANVRYAMLLRRNSSFALR